MKRLATILFMMAFSSSALTCNFEGFGVYECYDMAKTKKVGLVILEKVNVNEVDGVRFRYTNFINKSELDIHYSKGLFVKEKFNDSFKDSVRYQAIQKITGNPVVGEIKGKVVKYYELQNECRKDSFVTFKKSFFVVASNLEQDQEGQLFSRREFSLKRDKSLEVQTLVFTRQEGDSGPNYHVNDKITCKRP